MVVEVRKQEKAIVLIGGDVHGGDVHGVDMSLHLHIYYVVLKSAYQSRRCHCAQTTFNSTWGVLGAITGGRPLSSDLGRKLATTFGALPRTLH